MLLLVFGLMVTSGASSDAVQQELEDFRGTWKIISVEMEGTKMPEEQFRDAILICKGDHFGYKSPGEVAAGTFRIDPNKKPKTMDITFTEGPQKGKSHLAIYELDGDTYRLCLSFGTDRPTEFASKPNSGHVLEVLKRVKR
jgi:uncharacterized protein (TIGR03067 family)